MSEETPLKTLFDFLNEKVYSKMKKKDVKELKESCLGGEIEKQCTIYANEKVKNILSKKNIEIITLKENMEELRARLREYEPEDIRGYGEGRYSGD